MNNTPFSSRDAELAVIGAMLQDKNAVSFHATIQEQDFSELSLKTAFRAIRSLAVANKPIDLETVDHEMAKSFGPLGSNPYTEVLIEAIQYTPTTANVKQYIEIIREKSMRRQLVDVSQQISSMASDLSVDVAFTLDNARTVLRQMNSGNAKWVSISDVLMASYMKLEKRMAGEVTLIPTGIDAFDRAFGGYEKGEYIILGARPSVGKSALGMHMALSAAKRGYKVGVISREMTAPQYGDRVLSSGAFVHGSKFRTGKMESEDLDAILLAMGPLSNLPIQFLFPLNSIEALRMEIQKKVDAGELDLLIVDYLQLLTSEEKAQKDYRRIAIISGALRDMTRDLGIPIIALAQLKRLNEGVRRVPQLSDLRESGDIEQDADIVLLMHRCEGSDDPGILRADQMNYDALTSDGSQYIMLYAAKGRMSGTGKIAVLFHPEIMQYISIQREYAENNSN